jgi:hypothetical protein
VVIFLVVYVDKSVKAQGRPSLAVTAFLCTLAIMGKT